MFKTSVKACIIFACFWISATSQAADFVEINGIKASADTVLAKLKPAQDGKVRALSVPNAEVAHRSSLVSGLVELKKPVTGGLQAQSIEQKAEDLKKWIADLQATGQFEYVEPDFIRQPYLNPNDARFVDGTLCA